MGFDCERRYAAEYDQTPRDKTSVPKESVDHERLLLETAWLEYRPTEGGLTGPAAIRAVLLLYRSNSQFSCLNFAIFCVGVGDA